MTTSERTAGILLATVFAFVTAPAFADVKVFLLAGQSNMGGVGIASQLTSPYNFTQSPVQFWFNGAWTGLHADFYGSNYGGSNRFGPEVSFGYTLATSIYPNDSIYLVKYGPGSTSLAVDWKPDGTGLSYNIFKTKVDDAMQNLTDANLSPTIAGMIWMQGESDVKLGYASQYRANLESFITIVRSDFATPDMPFVVGRISTFFEVTNPADSELVRTAQETVPGVVGNASWIDTDSMERWPADSAQAIHYNTQGQIDLGISFANAVTALPEPSTFILGIVGLLTLVAIRFWRRH